MAIKWYAANRCDRAMKIAVIVSVLVMHASVALAQENTGHLASIFFTPEEIAGMDMPEKSPAPVTQHDIHLGTVL
jgi:hypothetical protein